MVSAQASLALVAMFVFGAFALDTGASDSASLRGSEQVSAFAPPPEVPSSTQPSLLGHGNEAVQQPSDKQQPAPRGFLSSQPSLRRQGVEVSVADVKTSLVRELAGNASSERLQELEASLRPMYDALPKEESGYLGHQAVRYALHRLLLQRHGWFIVGLEPTDEALPPYLHTEWVPQYLQGLLEQRLGDRGLDLHETAALAASLEDLVHAEASRRLDLVFDLLRLPIDARVTGSEADRILETYMMMYLNGGDFTAPGKDIGDELVVFKQEYSDWESAAAWMQQVKGHHINSASDGKLSRGDLMSIATELGERFGAFNDGECHSLKRELMGLEGSQPGRVALLDFYKKGLYSHWEFNEKFEYLRVLGALDESDELHPSIIMSNYVGSRPNCLTASSLYAVCCRNECEDLMGHLERKLAAPAASPQHILELVSDLPSDTVNASRRLSDSLVRRLQGIAEMHGGQVPLHGRLFAQWMHHAYPRECPYPHEGGVNPQTPDAWMQDAGQEREARASEAEVRQILGNCATSGADGAPCRAQASVDYGMEVPADLPWTDAEILLTKGPVQTTDPSPWLVAAKAVLAVGLLAVLTLHKSGRLNGRSRDQKRLARNLDFADFDDLDDDVKKPSKIAQQWRPWMVLLVLVIVCTSLERMGVLDGFSFCCTLLGGLLLNVALPLIMRRNPVNSKGSKHYA
mmetsp:Transcript_173947/g.423102  ORF Transcript_173947/g.423102 Transcript_173947/m.423102 type:complete len:689 (+) Transcript_173947:123-2189(+)